MNEMKTPEEILDEVAAENMINIQQMVTAKQLAITAIRRYARIYHQSKVKNNAVLPHVSGSALDDGERIHYDSLRECCDKILDAVDAGKVPQRAIMGLRLLMNR